MVLKIPTLRADHSENDPVIALEIKHVLHLNVGNSLAWNMVQKNVFMNVRLHGLLGNFT